MSMPANLHFGPGESTRMGHVPMRNDFEAAARSSDCDLKQKLPMREWLLLTAISLLTMGLLLAGTELTARRWFSNSKSLLANCMVLNDPSTGPRAIANCACSEKIPESPLTEYTFNSCGHRAGIECGPKPPGIYRIVMTGSSFPLGELVAQERTFAALLPPLLSQKTGRRIEVYNESMAWGFSHSVSLHFNQVLAAQPDLILWVVTPGDIQAASVIVHDSAAYKAERSLNLLGRAWLHAKESFESNSTANALSQVFGRTRSAIMLRHYLFQSQSQFVRSYLMSGDGVMGFLRAEPRADWKESLRNFDADAADVETRARAAGLPFVAMLAPNQAQVAMISMGKWPAGFDPYKLDSEVRSIIESHGGIYLSILPDYRSIPNPEQGFFPVDGHPNPEGHALIASLLAKELTSGAVPALKARSTMQSKQAKGDDR